MLVLAFDASSSAVTVALRSKDQTVAARTEVATNRHGELLAPSIAAVMAEAGAAPRDLGAIAVGLGPGPFTGLRVGIVTAKSMGDALGIPVYGEPSLDVIAHGLDFAAYDYDDDEEHGYVVMSDARRKQVYWAEYDAHGQRLSEFDIARPADVAAAIRGRVRHVGGQGALLYRDEFAEFTVLERHPYPEAADLAAMVSARAVTSQPGDDLTPLYLRRPDAQPPGAPKQVTPV